MDSPDLLRRGGWITLSAASNKDGKNKKFLTILFSHNEERVDERSDVGVSKY
ncbi:MAG: hypothetical protein JKY70_17450, partial [Mucilaginibacter sp.]|nr:hypothetical protein [Mucilaginibacter sp.]